MAKTKAKTKAETMRDSYSEWQKRVGQPDTWDSAQERGLKLAVEHDETALRAAVAIRAAHNRKLGLPLGS